MKKKIDQQINIPLVFTNISYIYRAYVPCTCWCNTSKKWSSLLLSDASPSLSSSMDLKASIKQLEAFIYSELGTWAEFVAEPGKSYLYALFILIKLSFQDKRSLLWGWKIVVRPFVETLKDIFSEQLYKISYEFF